MPNKKLLYYVIPKESFKAEGRIFLKGEKYPVYDNDGFSIVCAENGEFNFVNHLMSEVISEWDLEVSEV